jgi:ribose transport system ATP-binding protein
MALASGYPRTRVGTIDWRRARQQARRSLEALGYDFDPALAVSQLRPVERAGTAIARAVSDSGDPVKLLVLDEPTAALPTHECETLFDAVRRLARNGTAVLYVTHHLDEVFTLADRVSILRNGRIVDDAPVRDRTPDMLIEAMSGRPIPAERGHRASTASGPASLRVRALRTNRLAGIDLSAAPGEIVGVAGITGSGRDEVGPALMGTIPREGEVRVSDVLVPPLRPHRAVAAGMACIPADRVGDALLPTMTVKQNITIAGLRSLAGRRLVRPRLEARAASSLVGQLSVRPAMPGMPIVALSGGNQQKVVLGRWLSLSQVVFVLDAPTQGVDVEARAIVYRELRKASARSAVLVCSSDSDELAELCDRVLVIRNGRAAAELSAPISAAEIDAIALGSSSKDGDQ